MIIQQWKSLVITDYFTKYTINIIQHISLLITAYTSQNFM